MIVRVIRIAVAVILVAVVLIALMLTGMHWATGRYNSLSAGMTRRQVRNQLGFFRETKLRGNRGGNIQASDLPGYPNVTLYRYDALGLPSGLTSEVWMSVFVAYDRKGRLIVWDDND